MKKSVTPRLGLFLAMLVILVSSCSTNATFTKRYHSRGFNIAWGGGSEVSPKNSVAKKVKLANSGANVVVKPLAVRGEISTEKLITPLMQTVQGIAFQPYATSHNVDVPSVSKLNHSIAELKSTSSFIQRPIKIGKIQKNRSKSNQEVLKEKKMEPIFGTAKSQIVALLLCLFFGYLGIHRFYLGYTLAGVIQLLILGTALKYKLKLVVFLALLWVLIDLIRIFLGDLQPLNGSYYDSF
jgi:TM2 domain-containing membrane protein YozV